MANYCNNGFFISGSASNISKLHKALKEIQSQQQVFETLVGGPAIVDNETENIERFDCNQDVSKADVTFSFDGKSIAGYFDTNWKPALAFFQILSSIYEVKIIVEYDSEGEDYKGKNIYKNGQLINKEVYRFMEGMYRFDMSKNKKDFWYELENTIEISYSDQYESANEVIKEELPFLNKTERQQFKELFEAYL